MKKTWKRIMAFLLVGVMTFGIYSVSMAAPETANTPTDSPEPPTEFEQFLNSMGIKDLEGLDFENLPSGNTLIKMSDEDEEMGPYCLRPRLLLRWRISRQRAALQRKWARWQPLYLRNLKALLIPTASHISKITL